MHECSGGQTCTHARTHARTHAHAHTHARTHTWRTRHASGTARRCLYWPLFVVVYHLVLGPILLTLDFLRKRGKALDACMVSQGHGVAWRMWASGGGGAPTLVRLAQTSPPARAPRVGTLGNVARTRTGPSLQARGTQEPKLCAREQIWRGGPRAAQGARNHVTSTDLDMLEAFGAERRLGDDTVVVKLKEPQQRRRVHHLRIPAADKHAQW